MGFSLQLCKIHVLVSVTLNCFLVNHNIKCSDWTNTCMNNKLHKIFLTTLVIHCTYYMKMFILNITQSWFLKSQLLLIHKVWRLLGHTHSWVGLQSHWFVVVVFSNFTIVTGDSLGNTQFWDGLQGTLIQVS